MSTLFWSREKIFWPWTLRGQVILTASSGELYLIKKIYNLAGILREFLFASILSTPIPLVSGTILFLGLLKLVSSGLWFTSPIRVDSCDQLPTCLRRVDLYDITASQHFSEITKFIQVMCHFLSYGMIATACF